MINLLLLILFIMVIISFILTGRDLLSPWVITCCVFMMSALFVVPNINSWQVQFEFETIIVICLGLFSFGFGEIIVRKFYKKKLLVNQINIRSEPRNIVSRKTITIPILFVFFSIIFMIIVTYFYYKQVLQFAYAAGYTPSSNLPMLRFARIATTTDIAESVSTNKLLGQCVILCYSYAYLMLYVIIYNVIFYKFKKVYIFYAIPIIIYLIQVILTGGRTQFIYLISAILLISIVLYQIKVGWNNKNNFKYIKISLISFCIMLIIFYFLGTYTGKTSKLNLLETISIYTGSSIIAFDIFFRNYISSNPEYFGINTLHGIYDILDKFGFNVPILANQANFISFGNYETNVYTSYMRYIKDFTILGFILIEIFLGIFYSFLYLKIKILNKPSILIVIYAILFQVIIESSIEERFFMNILSIGYILRIVYLVLLYIILVKFSVRIKRK